MREMVEDIEKATQILPAWFMPRMMGDTWVFALLLITGHTMVITRIEGVSEDGAWIDVTMFGSMPHEAGVLLSKEKAIVGLPDRPTASVHVFSVVAAYELAST